MNEDGAARIIGIAVGTLLSLIFVPPRSVAGFFRRLIAAVLFGWVFGHIALAVMINQFDVENTPENITAAWALASFSSWTLMSLWRGVLKRRSEEI
ncbi:DUF6107 family protein [Allorhizobium ampelinum]|uniref:DUF6107 family protein n=1 Tax=Allorhizobium ampelinum TaxID=3025782 RepID=UPI000B402EA8|nr:DUF6107 family protein [Allorhizobium ampelinum]NTA27377.1 hypothetical protein [Allorhizobium ampelinum]OVE94432.1 hypothetical protein B7W85_12845 [Allorhizobium ampelinum]